MNTWIFQANPKRYKDVEERLKNPGKYDFLIEWAANQNANIMKLGDKVYIWIAGDKPGIHAIGRLISAPHSVPNNPDDLYVDIKIERLMRDDYVKRELFINNPSLKKLPIVTANTGTNFLIREIRQIDEIDKLIESSKSISTTLKGKMNQIILQPAGDSDANIHFIDTIKNPVEVSRIAKFVSVDVLQKLKDQHKDGKVATWGVTPGKNDVNRKKWERVLPGDIALFSRSGKIFASATVAFTIHNKELALDLWKTNADGETWEYIYFLDEVTNQDILYSEFNSAAGYEPNFVIQGFNVLDKDKSQQIIDYFKLGSETYYPPVSREDYIEAISIDPSKTLDKESIVKSRTEQAFLRNYLFHGKKYVNCGLCGKEFPISFLVAAHIKKRANCSEEERRDHKNIIMPMCRFGCDELYEKGYITILNGEIVRTKNLDATEIINGYIHELEGKSCSYWNNNTQKYFKWHCDLYLT